MSRGGLYVSFPQLPRKKLMNTKEIQIGNKVKLKDYTLFGDYQIHGGQLGTVAHISPTDTLPIRIKWDDGDSSQVSYDNVEVQITILTDLVTELKID